MALLYLKCKPEKSFTEATARSELILPNLIRNMTERGL